MNREKIRDWWNSQNQKNKMIFIVAVVAAVLSSILNSLGYLGKDWLESAKVPIDNSQPTVTQTTSGDNSPAFSGTKGDVTINFNSPDAGKQP